VEVAVKRYHLTSGVTISLNTVVEARSKSEALKIARERRLVDIRATWQDDPEEEWCTSGELDGEIGEITIEEVEPVKRGGKS